MTELTRNRQVPFLIYLPDIINKSLPVVIFNPGYQEQKYLKMPNTIFEYRKWEYLAKYFTSKNHVFITIQHDLPGDTDGLETIDPTSVQSEARKHLWIRGEKNILFVINELKIQFPNFDFNKFIISGHSNGDDIAKF